MPESVAVPARPRRAPAGAAMTDPWAARDDVTRAPICTRRCSAQENENSRGNPKRTRNVWRREEGARRFLFARALGGSRSRSAPRLDVQNVFDDETFLVDHTARRLFGIEGCAKKARRVDSLDAFDLTWADARWPHPRARGSSRRVAPAIPAPRERGRARAVARGGAACRRSNAGAVRRTRDAIGFGSARSAARATGTARERTRTRTSAITTRWSPRCGCPCVTSGWATSARTSACCNRRSASSTASSTRAPRGRSRGGNTTSGSPRRGTSASRLARRSRAPPPTPGTRSASGERRGTRRAARGGQHRTGTPSPSCEPRAGRRSARSRPSRRHEAAAKPTEVRCASRRIAPISNPTPSGVGVPVVAGRVRRRGGGRRPGAAASRPPAAGGVSSARRSFVVRRDDRTNRLERFRNEDEGDASFVAAGFSRVSSGRKNQNSSVAVRRRRPRVRGATSPAPAVVAILSARKARRRNDGASPTSGSLPAKPFYVATSPARRRRRALAARTGMRASLGPGSHPPTMSWWGSRSKKT